MSDVKVDHCPTCELPILVRIGGKVYDIVPMSGDDE